MQYPHRDDRAPGAATAASAPPNLRGLPTSLFPNPPPRRAPSKPCIRGIRRGGRGVKGLRPHRTCNNNKTSPPYPPAYPSAPRRPSQRPSSINYLLRPSSSRAHRSRSYSPRSPFSSTSLGCLPSCLFTRPPLI
ncbi:hypothetical protein EJ06DRAFT_401694 [Trichodelitschia bisporula]|uniref:Uncharacterized protein n=1 Tax=Trichodelitschia bisporula TaxID=703511 RepID=A0A6G1HXR2_9PEZI|nr:hypothetical protein EJ06DRAFT_401694 [Trichodelitschia bisporula]